LSGEFVFQETSEGTLPTAAPPPDSKKAVIPAVIDLLSMTLIMVFEGILLGRYSSAALAGGGMGLMFLFFLFTIFLTFVMGAAVPISRHLGANEKRLADRLFSNSIGATLLASIAFAIIALFSAKFVFGTVFGADGAVRENAVDYFRILIYFMPIIALNFTGTGILRATGDAFAAMTANLIANCIHAGLAIILIFGSDRLGIPAMGAAGAALALGIAQVIGLTVQMRFVLSGKTQISLNLRDILAPKWQSIKRILKTGLPVTTEQLVWMTGQLVLLAYIARLGESYLAAHQILLRLTQTVGVVYQGLAFGNMALCGQHIGAGCEDRAIKISRRIRYLSLGFSIAIGSIIYFNAGAIVRLFTFDPAVMEITLLLMPILALQQIPKSQTMITASELRARGDLVFIAAIAAVFVGINEITLSGIAVFALKWGLAAIWAFMVIDEVERVIVHLLRMRRRIVKHV